MVADARQVLHPATTNEHDGVLLKIVPLTGDIGRNFEAVSKPHARDLPKRRVRLFRRRRIDPGAYATLLRVGPKRWRLILGFDVFPAAPDELIDSRHNLGAWEYEMPRFRDRLAKVVALPT